MNQESGERRPPIAASNFYELAAAWLFPLGRTILSSFKTWNVAIFERPFALPDGITFANYQQAIPEGRRDYFIAKGPIFDKLPP